MDAFERGFLKKAQEYGLTEKQASNVFGRYAEMLKQPGESRINHPLASIAAAIPGSLPGVGPLAEIPANMLYNRAQLGKTPAERKHTFNDQNKELDHRTYGQSAAKGAKAFAGPMAAIGGLGVPLAMYLAHQGNPVGNQFEGKDYLSAALGGAAGGGLIGAGSGALSGMFNKLVHNNTGQESKDRANKMLAKHPYATELPFGRLAGAAFA